MSPKLELPDWARFKSRTVDEDVAARKVESAVLDTIMITAAIASAATPSSRCRPRMVLSMIRGNDLNILGTSVNLFIGIV